MTLKPKHTWFEASLRNPLPSILRWSLCAPVTYFEELLGAVSLGNMVKRTKIEKVLMQMTIETAAPFMRMAIEKALSQQPTKAEVPHETEKILEKSQFISKLDQRIEEMRMMSGGTLAVAFMEVDNYHLFVQSHGINSGENALRLVGKLLISALHRTLRRSHDLKKLYSVYYLSTRPSKKYIRHWTASAKKSKCITFLWTLRENQGICQ